MEYKRILTRNLTLLKRILNTQLEKVMTTVWIEFVGYEKEIRMLNM